MINSNLKRLAILLGIPLALLLGGCVEETPQPTEQPEQTEDVDEEETYTIGVSFEEDKHYPIGNLTKDEAKLVDTILSDPLQDFKEELNLVKLSILEAKDLTESNGLVTGTLIGEQRKEGMEHVITINVKENVVLGYDVGEPLEEKTEFGERAEFAKELVDGITYDSENISENEIDVVRKYIVQNMVDFKEENNVDGIFIYEISFYPSIEKDIYNGFVLSNAKKGLDIGSYNVSFYNNEVTGHSTSVQDD